jgi:hypothetical protein
MKRIGSCRNILHDTRGSSILLELRSPGVRGAPDEHPIRVGFQFHRRAAPRGLRLWPTAAQTRGVFVISRVLAGFAATMFFCAVAGCLGEAPEPELIVEPQLETPGRDLPGWDCVQLPAMLRQG